MPHKTLLSANLKSVWKPAYNRKRHLTLYPGSELPQTHLRNCRAHLNLQQTAMQPWGFLAQNTMSFPEEPSQQGGPNLHYSSRHDTGSSPLVIYLNPLPTQYRLYHYKNSEQRRFNNCSFPSLSPVALFVGDRKKKKPDTQRGQRAWGHRRWPKRAPRRALLGRYLRKRVEQECI